MSTMNPPKTDHESSIIRSTHIWRKEGSYIKKWKCRWMILRLCHHRKNTYWITIHKTGFRKKHLNKPLKKMELTTNTLIVSINQKKFSITNTKLHQQLILKSSSPCIANTWIECLNIRQTFLQNRLQFRQKNSLKVHEPKVIQLFIVGDFLETLTSIKVDSMITILELKHMISAKFRIDSTRIRLCMYDNKKPLLQTETYSRGQ